jgi:hypothetical protein
MKNNVWASTKLLRSYKLSYCYPSILHCDPRHSQSCMHAFTHVFFSVPSVCASPNNKSFPRVVLSDLILSSLSVVLSVCHTLTELLFHSCIPFLGTLLPFPCPRRLGFCFDLFPNRDPNPPTPIFCCLIMHHRNRQLLPIIWGNLVAGKSRENVFM